MFCIVWPSKRNARATSSYLAATVSMIFTLLPRHWRHCIWYMYSLGLSAGEENISLLINTQTKEY